MEPGAGAGRDNVALAYEAVQSLQSNSDDAEQAYTFLVDSVKAQGVQQLVAQYIPLYYGKFPALNERAFNAQIDLCEDESQNVRVAAIKGISVLCRKDPECVTRMAAVLAQLLDATDVELQNVMRSLKTLLELDTTSTLFAIFHQATSSAEVNMRKRLLGVFTEFMATSHSKNLASDTVFQDKLAERAVAAVKEMHAPVDEADMENVLSFFNGLPRLQTSEFAQALYDAMIEACPTTDISDAIAMEHLSRTLSASNPLIRKQAIMGLGLARLFAENILPAVGAAAAGTSASAEENLLFSLLKHLVLAGTSLTKEIATILLPPVVSTLGACVGGSGDGDTAMSAADEPKETAATTTPPARVHFTFAECLLHVFHACGLALPEEATKYVDPADAASASIRSQLTQLQQSARAKVAKVSVSLRKSKPDLEKRKRAEVVLGTAKSIDSLLAPLTNKKTPVFGGARISKPSWSEEKGKKIAGRVPHGSARQGGTASGLRQQLLAAKEDSASTPAIKARRQQRTFGSVDPPPSAASASATTGAEVSSDDKTATATANPADPPTERRKRAGIVWKAAGASKRMKETPTVTGVPATKEEKEQRIAAARARAVQEKEKQKELAIQSSSRYLPPGRRANGGASQNGSLTSTSKPTAEAGSLKTTTAVRKGRGTFSKWKGSMAIARSEVRRF